MPSSLIWYLQKDNLALKLQRKLPADCLEMALTVVAVFLIFLIQLFVYACFSHFMFYE